jgi:hypothetical protein
MKIIYPAQMVNERSLFGEKVVKSPLRGVVSIDEKFFYVACLLDVVGPVKFKLATRNLFQ